MNEPHPFFADALAALDRGDVATLRALLGEDPSLVTARATSDEPPYDGYFNGATLLHHIAGNPVRAELPENMVEIARALLEAGAEVDATCGGGPSQPESAGGTTLGLLVSGAQAHMRGLTEPLLDCLLDAGAEMDVAGDGGCMWIALYHTVEHRGQREVAEMLFERGHPVDLCFAAGLGELEIVEGYFRQDGSLAEGADRFYRHHRRSGSEASEAEILQDAFLFACINGHRETAELLLSRGARVNEPRGWGGESPTPLHGAVWAGWLHLVEFLLEEGADVHARDVNHASSPIGWAIHCGRQEALDYLLEDPANVDLLDAFELGRVDLFENALGDGDPDQDIGPGGRGVLLRAAAYSGRQDIVEFLLARGADPRLANPEGKTALDWALEEDHQAIVELLRQRIAAASSPGL